MVRNSSLAILAMAVLIVLSAGLAGCTSTPPATTAKATPAAAAPAVTSASGFVLSTAELPVNFTVAKKGDRNATDISEWGLGHGWESGYYAIYQPAGPDTRTEVQQVMSIYAPGNATLAVNNTINGTNEMVIALKDVNQTSEKLTLPALGDASGALKLTDKPNSSVMYLIAFAKNDVFVDIRTEGSPADYENALKIATAVAAKIP